MRTHLTAKLSFSGAWKPTIWRERLLEISRGHKNGGKDGEFNGRCRVDDLSLQQGCYPLYFLMLCKWILLQIKGSASLCPWGHSWPCPDPGSLQLSSAQAHTSPATAAHVCCTLHAASPFLVFVLQIYFLKSYYLLRISASFLALRSSLILKQMLRYKQKYRKIRLFQATLQQKEYFFLWKAKSSAERGWCLHCH